MADKTDTVRVWEPDPKTPANQLPMGGGLGKPVLKALGRTVLATVLMLGGIALFFAGLGVAAPIFVLNAGVVLLLWACPAIGGLRWILKWESRPDLEFECVDADHVVARRKKVAVRLPDGRWLHIHLPAGSRVQLAGQRRLWLVRSGNRAIVVLPGAAVARLAYVREDPLAGATELPAVSRELVPPRLDPVVIATRRGLIPRVVRTLAPSAVAAGLAAWTLIDAAGQRPTGLTVALTVALVAAAAAVGLLLAIFRSLTLLGIRRTLRRDTWTELPVQADLAQLPDGRTARIRWAKVSASVAHDVAASETLWIYGRARPGYLRAGVPGYPVSGPLRLKVVRSRAK